MRSPWGTRWTTIVCLVAIAMTAGTSTPWRFGFAAVAVLAHILLAADVIDAHRQVTFQQPRAEFRVDGVQILDAADTTWQPHTRFTGRARVPRPGHHRHRSTA